MKTFGDSYNTAAYSDIQNQVLRATDLMRSSIKSDEYHLLLFLLLLKRDGLIGVILSDINNDFDSHSFDLLTEFKDRLRRKEGWWTPFYQVYEPILSKFNVFEFGELLNTVNS